VRRNILGISQGAASIVALAATAIIVAIALSAQLPSLYFVQAAGSQEAGKAEKLAGVRLSLVAVLEDGTAIIANDGPDPVTIDKLYTPSGVISLTSPITVQPGQKISINLGSKPDALAAALPDGRKVVLKEKPGVQIATLTTSVNPTSTTRIGTTTSTTTTTTTTQTTTTITTSVTRHSTTYRPLTVTYTYTYAASTVSTGTLTLYTYSYHQPYVSCSTTYTYRESSTVYTDTMIVGTWVTPRTITATVYIRSTITTSLKTATTPNTLYYVTSVVTTSPSPTYTSTQTSYYTVYSWSVFYTRTSFTSYIGSVGPCYLYIYSYVLAPAGAYLYHISPTVTLTTVTVR
jgi:hypothetical protein